MKSMTKRNKDSQKGKKYQYKKSSTFCFFLKYTVGILRFFPLLKEV